MAIDTPARHIYSGDGSTRVFPIPTYIQGDDYIRIEINGVHQADRSKWDIVNNSIIFVTAPISEATIDVQVATSVEALTELGSITNIDIVAANIEFLHDNIDGIVSAADNAQLALQYRNEAEEFSDSLNPSVILYTLDNIAELKLSSGAVIDKVELLGYYTKGDGGGGLFYWDSTSTEADNGGTIIQATSITTGRWKRTNSGAVNVKWFGASNNLTNSETQLKNSLLNNYNIVLPSETLKVATALKIPSYRKIDGKSFSAYIGSTSESKNSIKKTSNTLVAITNFQSSVTTNIDCIAYIDPYWINGGYFYPQAVELNNVAFEGNDTPNNIGLYIEQGGNLVFNNVTFTNSKHNVRAKECWTTAFNQCRGDGVFDWRGGTSLTLSTCWFKNGYNFQYMQYSTLTSCASDGATFSAYSINNSKMVLNGCGCENATSGNNITGTAINVTGGNNLEINGFNCVPKGGQTAPIFSVNDGDYVVFNGGSSSYMTGLTCADLQVNFANATVIFNDYTFHNGSKDNPNIKFNSSANGSSKVIVNYGKLTKIYVCDSSGNTIVYDGKIKNVASTRAFNVTYTNTTFKDMIVCVSCGTGATGSYAVAKVDGMTVGIAGVVAGTTTIFAPLTFKVPIGSTYVIINAGTLTINSWTEER